MKRITITVENDCEKHINIFFKCRQLKMALKNYIAKSLYLEKVKKTKTKQKKSIAHNNSKLTCNIYHIQVLSSPFSKRVLIYFKQTVGIKFSSLFNSVLKKMLSSCTANSSNDIQSYLFLRVCVYIFFFPLCILLILDYGEGFENNMGRVQGVWWP